MAANKRINVLCTICARGGSKGVKNKNVRLINNKPLIAHTVEVAKASGLFSDIVVSTDCDDIADAATSAGARVLFKRPAHLASDKAAKLPVIRHAFMEAERLLDMQYDVLFDLDATSPLRKVDDILGCYAMINSGEFRNVITASPARRSPYFNLIEIDGNGTPFVSKGSLTDRRQDSPKCFDMNASIYVWTRESILNDDKLFSDKTGLFVMPEERSLDIDTELDFSIVSALMEQRL
ncbi:acylneuraminate cytidylyltransferase family protein [Photobacterium sagamiensis]|uniref:acylneuraminate cytidylyltransferase family protein n=1 Tax=Photobacterium sagamiensis TaxID=2910241 RepID=UPI003D10A86C